MVELCHPVVVAAIIPTYQYDTVQYARLHNNEKGTVVLSTVDHHPLAVAAKRVDRCPEVQESEFPKSVEQCISTHHALYEMATTQYIFATHVNAPNAMTQFVILLL